MRIRTAGLLSLGLSAAASLAAWPRLAGPVPVHWNIHGEVDRYGSRAELVLVGPLLLAATWALLALLLRVDPKWQRLEQAARLAGAEEERAELARARRVREDAVAAVLFMLAALHGAVLALGAGILRDPARPIALILAAFLLVFGNVLGRVRPNWFIGIRTPWTLSDDEVWRRTHRLAGRCMVGAGALLLPLAVALRGTALFVALVVLAGLPVLPPVAWSYVLWKRKVQKPG
jgi:uncharacterized membrane protein